MNILKNKMGKKSGFTLVEMLIVVAIIAILIAISIPLVSSALESARDRTDQANERSAKAEALIIYLDAGKTSSDNLALYNALIGTTGCAYDAVSGKLVLPANAPKTAYGQCTKEDAVFAGEVGDAAPSEKVGDTVNVVNTNKGPHNNHILYVQCNSAGDVVLTWVEVDD